MNPVLWYRDQLGQVSQPLQDELDQLVANIGTGWAVEHDDQGHHTTITCQSITTARVRSNPSAYATLDFRGGNGAGGAPLYVPAGIMWLSVMSPAAQLLVTGIQQGQPGDQQPGDVLWIRTDPAAVSYLVLQQGGGAGVPSGCSIIVPSKLAWPGLPPPPNQFRLSPIENTYIPLIYQPNMISGVGAWTLPHFVSD